MTYGTAAAIAVAICEQLKPFCDKLNIAGSVRRHKADVKDIEIVALPKMNEVTNLFGEVVGAEVEGAFVVTVNQLGEIVKGSPVGRYMQIALPEGINLDLFLPQAHDFYRQYAIRTGSADYASKVIAAAWVKNGWRGTDEGLRLQKDCYAKDLGGGKQKWICPTKNAEVPPVWQSEQEFFEWLKVPFIHPSQR